MTVESIIEAPQQKHPDQKSRQQNQLNFSDVQGAMSLQPLTTPCDYWLIQTDAWKWVRPKR